MVLTLKKKIDLTLLAKYAFQLNGIARHLGFIEV